MAVPSRLADASILASGEKAVAELFDKYNLLTLPVVDDHNKLTGVITSDDIISMLRAKIDTPGSRKLIHTSRGVGYVVREEESA